jgi:hypothetical protein
MDAIMPLHRESQKSTTAFHRLLHRRAFLTGAAAAGLMLPSAIAGAQTSPPIEPRDEQPVEPEDNGEQIIEPEPEPTISPNEDAETVIDVAGTTNVQYFAETGHNLDEPFTTAWTAAGGKDGPGLPLSEPRFLSNDGTVRQDFEAMAFVYRPDADPGSSLQGVPLPKSELTSLVPTTNRQPGTDTSPTGTFASWWQAHGGIQLLGQPVSEPFTKSGTTVQAFANAVLEQPAGGSVRLRKINVDIASKQYANDEAFVPAPPTLGTSWLVAASDGLRVRAGADANAEVIAVVPDSAEFIAAPGEHGSSVPGYVDGFSGWVAKEFLTSRDTLKVTDTSNWRLDVWEGVTLGDTNLRRSPSTSSSTVRTIAAGSPVVVVDWVEGEAVVENQITWAKLDDGSFVYARNIGRAAPVQPPPLPGDAPSNGRWIDVHLTQQLMVAYEGRDPVRTVVMTSGMPGWVTPTGWFHINNRVANETMESGSIGAENFYVLKNVLFTQYFTDRGHALHYAWWKNEETIGRPGSHGCINLLLDDAQFFWGWAVIGTPVICRRG